MTDEVQQMGRPAIYRNKNAKNIHGMITEDGAKLFELARAEAARVVKWPKKRVSDGDVLEFLARGFKSLEVRAACVMQMEKYLGRK